MRCARVLRAAAVCVLLAPLLTVSAFAQSPVTLSLGDAVRKAWEASPALRAAQARVAGAAARVSGAGAPPNPALSLAQPYGSATTGGFDEGILATQVIETGAKRRPRVRAARAEQDAARADLAQAENDVAFAAEQAYVESLRADAARMLAADALEAARTFAQAAQTQFEAGDVARSNVVRAQIEQTRVLQALDTAETERANRYAALRSVTGLPPDTPLTLTDSFDAAPGAAASIPPLSAVIAHALVHRPDLIAARQLRDARAADIAVARALSLPDLFVEGRVATLDRASSGSSIRVGVTLPLLDLGRNRAETRAARSARDEQDAAVAEAERAAKLEVETAFRNVEQARRAVESFRTGRLDRARELLEMARTGYTQGATSYIEFLDAQQVYRAEQTDYARALADARIARAALVRAAGGALP